MPLISPSLLQTIYAPLAREVISRSAEDVMAVMKASDDGRVAALGLHALSVDWWLIR